MNSEPIGLCGCSSICCRCLHSCFGEGRGWRCSRRAAPPQRRVAGGGALLQGGADCGPRLRPRKAAWAARIGWTGRHPPCDAARCVRERSTPRHSGQKGARCSALVIATVFGVRSAAAGADVLIFSGEFLPSSNFALWDWDLLRPSSLLSH